jgi:hypothetical protein
MMDNQALMSPLLHQAIPLIRTLNALYRTFLKNYQPYRRLQITSKPPKTNKSESPDLGKLFLVAFYSHRTKAIYISLKSITDRSFAHETAHAVINFYFIIPPPGRMQEILAQYVDKHLWEK